jgi:hypothetical protein
MADSTNRTDRPAADPTREAASAAVDEAVRMVNDPGDAHRKGYSAQAGPERPVAEEGPLPLASDAETHEHLQKPDQSQAVPPPAGSSAGNQRILGGGR